MHTLFRHQLDPHARLMVKQQWSLQDEHETKKQWPNAHISGRFHLYVMDTDLDDYEPVIDQFYNTQMEALHEAAAILEDYSALKAEWIKEQHQ